MSKWSFSDTATKAPVSERKTVLLDSRNINVDTQK